MRRLLTHLAQFSAFSKQGEVLCTRALEYLLQDINVSKAFVGHVCSTCPTGLTDLTQVLRWRAETRQTDNARPDLEAYAADGTPVVKLEAKLGAALTKEQIEAYARDLMVRTGRGVLVLLVPQHRTGEANEVIRRAEIPPEVHKVVCSWDEAFECLQHVSTGPLAGDLAQLEAMYRGLSGDYAEPLANEDAVLAWREREGVFINYVDRATRELSRTTKLLPLGLDAKKKPTDKGEPEDTSGRPVQDGSTDLGTKVPKGGYLRRYVFCFRQGPKESYFSIGVRDPFQGHVTPIWLRFNSDTGAFSKIRERLGSAPTPQKMVESGGHIWMPLEVKLESDLPTVVAAIVEQAARICDIARGA